MLRVDPMMLGRLEEIETGLLARRANAEAEGWLGELEGIDLTLLPWEQTSRSHSDEQ
jgi:hypothetical protein